MADHLPHTTTPGNPKDHDRTYLPEGIHLALIPKSAPGSLTPRDSMNCIPKPCSSVNGGRALTPPRSDIRLCVLLGTWPISTAIQVRAGWKRDRGPLFWVPCRARIQSSMRGSGLSLGCLKFLSGDPSFHFSQYTQEESTTEAQNPSQRCSLQVARSALTQCQFPPTQDNSLFHK